MGYNVTYICTGHSIRISAIKFHTKFFGYVTLYVLHLPQLCVDINILFILWINKMSVSVCGVHVHGCREY